MKLSKEDVWMLHFSDRAFAHIENDWRQLRGGWNWKTYRFIHIEFEDDKMMSGYEFTFVVLGFGFRVRYNNLDAPIWKELEDNIKEIKPVM